MALAWVLGLGLNLLGWGGLIASIRSGSWAGIVIYAGVILLGAWLVAIARRGYWSRSQLLRRIEEDEREQAPERPDYGTMRRTPEHQAFMEEIRALTAEQEKKRREGRDSGE